MKKKRRKRCKGVLVEKSISKLSWNAFGYMLHEKFGQLRVIGFPGYIQLQHQKNCAVRCVCLLCGEIQVFIASNVKKGLTTKCKSCSIKTKVYNNPNHGLSNTVEHKLWVSAKRTSVCERWKDIHNFIADIGEIQEGKKIIRQDLSKPLGPSNWEWSDFPHNPSRRSVVFNGKFVSLAYVGRALRVSRERVRQIISEGRFEEWTKQRLEFMEREDSKNGFCMENPGGNSSELPLYDERVSGSSTSGLI